MVKRNLKIYTSEARILQVLYKSPRSLTANEVADAACISWPTAIKYLKKWKTKGIVKKINISYHSIKSKKERIKETWTIDKKLFDKILEDKE